MKEIPMHRKLRLLFTIQLILSVVNISQAQQFSVLTCSRGDEIYSTFGHSAIRYVDTNQSIDWVYNYGLFDFLDPNFVPKFCMGRLDYMVGKETMNDFMGQYVYQQREVKEQVLILSKNQMDSLLKFLEWNILNENKYYRYDFLFNNCATKIIEVLEKTCSLKFKYYQPEDRKSFRELIHQNAENAVPYIDWGMDLALGTSTDRQATDREYCFLPEYISKSILISNLSNQNNILIQGMERSDSIPILNFPNLLAVILLLIALYHRYYDRSWSRKLMGFFFIILGIGGFVIGFEWFFTEHSVTKNNWNLFWLNPIALFYGISLMMNKEWKWVKALVSLGAIISMFAIIFSVQDFHTASKILILALFIHTQLFVFKFVGKYYSKAA